MLGPGSPKHGIPSSANGPPPEGPSERADTDGGASTSTDISQPRQHIVAHPKARRPRIRSGLPEVREPRERHIDIVLVLASIPAELGRLLSTARENRRRVAGALARPEARHVVVRAADEDVAQRVEGGCPDVRIVCLREMSDWSVGPCDLLWVVVVPVEDCAFGTTGGEDGMDWVECEGY